MDQPIKNRVIVVTGAGGGFGQLISQKCAVLGARIVCADINEEGLDQTITNITEAGGQGISQRTDVTSYSDLQALAAKAVNEFGAIDVMVNNAGTMPLAFYSDHAQAMAAWTRCIDINIKGVLHGIAAVHDQMISQGRGHVVNISSIYGNFPVVGAAVYGASKAAVNFLSESLRVEAQGKIKVTIVRPTGVPMTGLVGTIVNQEAIVGITGQNAEVTGARYAEILSGQAPPEVLDKDSIAYFGLDADSLTDQVVHAINQPWGVSIAEVTVRASGERYVL
ncbi:MAG: SDR family NAD(P)-dependent oxidoreductase [Gammaproteobacteria bacterium]|nr:SDR family NAD(P)-dependent oxidoreductase [Gammaproteobacteria bacterium]MYG12186.1 SDR family NAD(P)-dependent oxidoreductase [Gammaproteobacteria bacterium]